MTRIHELIHNRSGNCLNVYVTAGYPTLEATTDILLELDKNGVDLIELGIPYSDPLADGKTIQDSSSQALKNGMTLQVLFEQLHTVKGKISAPIILMGYYNQILQYGEERFLCDAQEAGVEGLIIPDLPMYIYEEKYKALFEKYQMAMSFLITPETSVERIKQADRLSSAFVYMLSQTGITGKTTDIEKSQVAYFKRIQEMNLQSARLIGFGIHDKETYEMACANSDGAIIGSAYIRNLSQSTCVKKATVNFIKSIRN